MRTDVSLNTRIADQCRLAGYETEYLYKHGKKVLKIIHDACRNTALDAEDIVEDLCSDSYETDELRRMSEAATRLEFFATDYMKEKYETVDRANRENLSGRAIDDDLLKEMVEAFRQIPSDVAQYTLTDEYETYARPYSDIYDIVHAWTGMNFSSIVNWDASEDSLYALRSVDLEKDWKELHLTETEKVFWIDRESSIKR